jgi:DNA-binding CsgD family transcriptional regulator
MAAARLAMSENGHQAVVEALEPIDAQARASALGEPGLFRWQHLYADALVRLGRFQEAGGFLARHEAIAAARGRRSAMLRLARARARLEGARDQVQEADDTWARALELARSLPMPYEQALTELGHGQFLRRRGQRRAAVATLTTARERFAALGAQPALELCERELTASGLKPGRRIDPDRSRLTPQEREVARLAASGRTNREVATELMVSIKTIEVHLTRIYGKLGIRSREDLAARLET